MRMGVVWVNFHSDIDFWSIVSYNVSHLNEIDFSRPSGRARKTHIGPIVCLSNLVVFVRDVFW